MLLNNKNKNLDFCFVLSSAFTIFALKLYSPTEMFNQKF